MVSVELRAPAGEGYVVVMPRGKSDTVDAGPGALNQAASVGPRDTRHAGGPLVPGVPDQRRQRPRAPGAG
jgi:hypothetical protein